MGTLSPMCAQSTERCNSRFKIAALWHRTKWRYPVIDFPDLRDSNFDYSMRGATKPSGARYLKSREGGAPAVKRVIAYP